MNIFLRDEDAEEIKPVSESADKAVVITPTVGKREQATPDLVKEMAALDALVLGPSVAAEIHGVPQSSASKYKDGKDIQNDELRARITATKYEIEDTAVSKLMETLNLIDPTNCTKERDKITILNGLSTLVERISEKKPENGNQQVHLHMYMPNQKKESDYKVIEA